MVYEAYAAKYTQQSDLFFKLLYSFVNVDQCISIILFASLIQIYYEMHNLYHTLIYKVVKDNMKILY